MLLARSCFVGCSQPILDAGVSSVIIVPDGPLHLVPFGALTDDSGTTLNRRLSIAAAPSATVYSTLKTERQLAIARRPFLGVAYTESRPPTTQIASNTRGIFDLRGADLKPMHFGREEIVEAANALGTRQRDPRRRQSVGGCAQSATTSRFQGDSHCRSWRQF